MLDSAVDHVDGQPADGAVVDLLADNGKFVARGLYNSQSRIRVRLYSWSPAEQLDATFWRTRIERAVEHRRRLRYDAADGAARLIYSEADGLSGLIVDRYGPYLVVQATALAMQRRIDELLPILAEASGARHRRTGRSHTGQARRIGRRRRALVGRDSHRGGVHRRTWPALWRRVGPGAEDRLLSRPARESFGGGRLCARRRVLDLFCYTGGFSLAAARLGGAAEVLGIDTSEKAVAVARAGGN